MKHLFRSAALFFAFLSVAWVFPISAVRAEPESESELEAEISLGLFCLDESSYRISLHGLSDLLDFLSTDEDSDRYGVFKYELILDEKAPVRIFGKIDRRGSKEWYDWRIQSTYVCHEKKTSSAVDSYVSNTDTGNWTVKLEKYDRKYYLPDSLETASLTVFHQSRPDQVCSFSFPMDQVRTDAVLDTPQFHADGMLTVRVPGPKTLTAKIDVPKMRKDFSCFSKEGKNKVFRFLIKAVVTSSEWIQITIDGEHADTPDEIQFYAGEYHLNADESNQYSYQDKTIPIRDASCSFGEDYIFIRISLPEDCPHDFRQMRYFALATNGRDIYSKYYIKSY